MYEHETCCRACTAYADAAAGPDAGASAGAGAGADIIPARQDLIACTNETYSEKRSTRRRAREARVHGREEVHMAARYGENMEEQEI